MEPEPEPDKVPGNDNRPRTRSKSAPKTPTTSLKLKITLPPLSKKADSIPDPKKSRKRSTKVSTTAEGSPSVDSDQKPSTNSVTQPKTRKKKSKKTSETPSPPSPSSPPSPTISTNQAALDAPKAASWTDADIECLLQYLLEHKSEAGDGISFTLPTFNAAAKPLNEILSRGATKTGLMVKNKWTVSTSI